MGDYPINYHILAEDFRKQQDGLKEYNQGDAEWLIDALHKMCNAYDKTGVFIVGLTEGPQRLAVCASQEQAEEYIGTLPNAEDGRYYIDGPCTEPITLPERWLRAGMAAALERTQVDDCGEATMILEQYVNLDGTPANKE
jgi:hypothetical protein